MTENVILIGMPGSGKSTAGVVLSKLLNYKFIDTDLLIQERENARLSEIIDRVGREGFHAIEEDVIASVETRHAVIATGGSAIYHPRAMAHARAIGTVVYIRISLEELSKRLGDLASRGVTFQPGQTLADLYAERIPLYEKYAHVTVDADGTDTSALAEAIAAALE